ncbi:hypothetical protein [Loigolactobacillus rennini]|uniref:Lipoprotein n=1 Tax=Loigolactobacillus rennini DSM 20253 TaxID=1423796 RepID=A0A0R2D6D7_9LACO|nr:hypothetical protein [Loigolactobacillus rennini]KRM98794.1 hypothetical protein FC24_GL001030 [Loigolactobacillus rennini DSM 20253]
MKKLYLMCAAALLGVSAVGCTNNNSSNANNNRTETTSTKASANNLKITKDLEKQFNSDNDKIVAVDVKTDVVDDQSKDNKPHEEIKVTVKDKDTIEKLKTDKNAIDNGNASDDQKMYIAGIQDIISNEAKKLNNNADTITFGYKMDADNTMLIAGSSKTKDFVKPVEINID